MVTFQCFRAFPHIEFRDLSRLVESINTLRRLKFLFSTSKFLFSEFRAVSGVLFLKPQARSLIFQLRKKVRQITIFFGVNSRNLSLFKARFFIDKARTLYSMVWQVDYP
jgi:hypothetical protein